MNKCPYDMVLIPVAITSNVGYYTYPCMSGKFMKWEIEYVMNLKDDESDDCESDCLAEAGLLDGDE